MSKTRTQFMMVQLSAAKYARQEYSCFTVEELYNMMESEDGDNPVEKRTVRRCLNDMDEFGLVHSKEVGNVKMYIVDKELLPEVDESRFYS